MVLTIDIGNTKTKVAVFDGEQLVEHIVFECFSKSDIDDLILQFESFDSVIISSVNADEEIRIADLLGEIGIKYCLLSYKLQLPFKIDYHTPETLGKDRIAALAGAYAIGGEGNYLVIDCGTCNTYDLLINGHFVGGNIAPGIQMRLDAMHHFTAALPQCTIHNAQFTIDSSLGDSTKSAILNGAYWGVINEINGYIERYSREFENLKVILTGGLFNLPIADYRLQIMNDNVELLFEPLLVPKGLNYIVNSLEIRLQSTDNRVQITEYR